MATWSGVVFKQNLLRALQNLRILIRQYSAGTGSDVGGRRGVVLNRNANAGGLPPLPGQTNLQRIGVTLPAPCLVENAPRAAQNRSMSLFPFAALPICCAVAVAATSAECETNLPPTKASKAEVKDEALLWQSLLAEASIIRVLAELRNAYDELAVDPLWLFAMEGAKAGSRGWAEGHQRLDPGDAIYELAKLTCEAGTSEQHDQNQGTAVAMDPMEALLELALIGNSSGETC